MYNGRTIAAFYVAGAIPGDRNSCVATDLDRDPTDTEHYVTYNQGRSGDDVIQTTLGWVDPRNYANRGCKSQNGAHCLAEAGWTYRDILPFYYGEDIQLVTAEGECVSEPTCEVSVAGEEAIIDEESGCFLRACRSGEWWWEHEAGWEGRSVTTYTTDDDEVDCYGRWRLHVEEAGEYVVEVYIEQVAPLSVQAPYRIRHAGQEESVVLSQAEASGWRELGAFAFAEGGEQWVQLLDNTGEAYTDESGTRIVFDAVRLRPVEGGGEDTGPGADSGGDEDAGGGEREVGVDAPSGDEDADEGRDAAGGDASSDDVKIRPDVPSESDSEEGEEENESFRERGYSEGCAVGVPGGRGRRGARWLVLIAAAYLVASRWRSR